jgi:peptidoglycan/LPS O-acetylase OafA/YrhL
MGAYKPALDGLRAIAAVAVVCVHTGVLHGGALGVDVFFVLSGFLITGILAERPDTVAFWVRRARRLYPALLTMLLVYVALAPLVLPAYAAGRWREAFFAGLYLTDYSILWGDRTSPLGHTWSLAIEEQFYLLWPLALPLLLRLKEPAKALAILWAGLTLARVAIFALYPDKPLAYYPLHAHSTGLVLGAALALGPRPRFGWLGAAILTALLPTTPTGAQIILWRIPLAEIGAALLVCDLVRETSLTRALSWEPLRKLGLISYGVYLWHLPIAVALDWLAPIPRTIAVLSLSISLATASWWTVERWVRSNRPSARYAPSTSIAG